MNREGTTRTTGRRWAYVGALLGAVVSILANVAHSYVPPAHAAAGWHPHAGAVVGAIFWPVALLVAIEVLARVPWPAGARWALIRFGGLVPVAAVAAIVSYRHLSGLLTYYGEDGITAAVGPLAVDGLMVMATGALLATLATTHVEPRGDGGQADPVPGAVKSRGSTQPVPAATRAPVPAPAPAVRPVPVPAGGQVPAPAPRHAVPTPASTPSSPTGTGSRSAQIRDEIRVLLTTGTDPADVNCAALDRKYGTTGVAKKQKARVLRDLTDAAEQAGTTGPAEHNGHPVDGHLIGVGAAP